MHYTEPRRVVNSGKIFLYCEFACCGDKTISILGGGPDYGSRLENASNEEFVIVVKRVGEGQIIETGSISEEECNIKADIIVDIKSVPIKEGSADFGYLS